jgi:hypothetical protein
VLWDRRLLRRVLRLKDPRVGLLATELDDLDILVEHLLGITLAAALGARTRRHADEGHVHLVLLLDDGLALVVQHRLTRLVINVPTNNVAVGIELEQRGLLGARLLAVHEQRLG